MELLTILSNRTSCMNWAFPLMEMEVSSLHYVNIDQLKEGDIIAKNIYGNGGIFTLVKGVKITNFLINRMKTHGINLVCIEDNLATIGGDDVINPALRAEATESIKVMTLMIKDSIQPQGKFLTVLDNVIVAIIDELSKNKKNLVSMLDLKTHDNYTYAHSVNVAVLALVVGIALGYDYTKLKNMGLGALLHDIGKTSIPVEILNKPGKLTADETLLIHKHPEIGFQKSRIALDIDPTGRAVILQHHEKPDGSGYPNGRTSDTIHEFAKVVAITDIFDALTSDRPYRRRWPIKETLDFMNSICGAHIDTEIYQEFVRHISPFPPGIKILVSDGREGYVLNNENILRPIVGFQDGTTLDLNKEPHLYLREIVE